MITGNETISPELVLVDPALAVSARARLPEPNAAASQVRLDSTRQENQSSERLIALANAALAIPDEPGTAGVRARRSWRLLAGAAAVTAVSLLLFDVRVQVGETPASAERSVGRVSAAPPTSVTSKAPGAKSHARPSRGIVARAKSRRFVWAPVVGTSGYHVEFFRGAVRVFSTHTIRPELTIPARWKSDGQRRSLVSGEYRWYVWPVISGRRTSQAIVQAKLVVR